MERHEWSPTERGKALGLCAAGRNSLQEITNIINIPKSTVHDIKTRGTGISKPRSGWPKKLSTRDIRQLIRYIRTNKSTRQITLTQLKKTFHLPVHENTIWNALQQAGYNHKVAQRRPYLNKCDRKRLKFARQHKDWTKEEWAEVLFSDEMACKVFIARRAREVVWRKADEK